MFSLKLNSFNFENIADLTGNLSLDVFDEFVVKLVCFVFLVPSELSNDDPHLCADD